MSVSPDEIKDLADRGWFVRDGFVGSEIAEAARTDAEGLPLRRAGMGRGEGYHQVAEERGDEIAWIDPAPVEGALATIWRAFEGLRVALNEAAFLGLTRFEVQVARYGAGGRYVRHRDAHRSHTGRT